MDGNRRWWNDRKGLELVENKLSSGKKTLDMVVEWCLGKKIPFLSVFALSVENLQRDDETLHELYDLLNSSAEEMVQKFLAHGVEATFVGDRSLFSSRVLSSIEFIEAKTRGQDRLKLSILFCYGGKQEIVSAAKRVAQRVLQGEISPEEITATTFEQELWSYPVPFPDLIVRTGRHIRLSNFLLYQAAYSELAFLDILWPDLSAADLDAVFEKFSSSTRTFGR